MNLSRKFLAGAILALLPLTGALACNTSAWNGGTTGTTVADDPDTAATNGPETAAVKRYSGKCGLQASANSFVTDNSPTADGSAGTPYRARFYVFTPASGAAQVFSAGDDDDGGNEVLAVNFTGSAFTATAPGGATATVGGIVGARWYMVEIMYQNGSPLELYVRGNGGTAFNSPEQSDTSAPTNAGPGGVGSASLGSIGAVTGSVTVDEFDSSRGNTRIGGLLRGDAAGESGGAPDGTCNANDVSAMISEFFVLNGGTGVLAPGQVDCSEDGTTNADDISCLINKFFAQSAQGGQPCGGA